MKNIDIEKLNDLKNSNNLTNKQIAQKANIAESVVGKIFAGINDNPTLDTLKKLADVLDCIVDDFLVQEKEYYSDRRTVELAEEIFEKPKLKMLLDASRDLNVSDLNAVIEIVNRIKGTKS